MKFLTTLPYEPIGDGYRFVYVIPEDGDNLISFSVIKWEKKQIIYSLDKKNIIAGFWGRIWNSILNVTGGNKTENSLLYVKCGEKEYTYDDLKNDCSIELAENQKLIIHINKDKLDGYKIEVKTNDQESVIVDEDSITFEFEFEYDEISSFSIEGVE